MRALCGLTGAPVSDVRTMAHSCLKRYSIDGRNVREPPLYTLALSGEHESDPVTLTTVNKTVIFIHTVHAVTVDPSWFDVRVF